jgi:hypothetical protein
VAYYVGDVNKWVNFLTAIAIGRMGAPSRIREIGLQRIVTFFDIFFVLFSLTNKSDAFSVMEPGGSLIIVYNSQEKAPKNGLCSGKKQKTQIFFKHKVRVKFLNTVLFPFLILKRLMLINEIKAQCKTIF